MGVALGHTPEEMKIGSELTPGTRDLFRAKPEAKAEKAPPAVGTAAR